MAKRVGGEMQCEKNESIGFYVAKKMYALVYDSGWKWFPMMEYCVKN